MKNANKYLEQLEKAEDFARKYSMRPELGAPFRIHDELVHEDPYKLVDFSDLEIRAAADVLRETDVIYASTHRAKILRFDPEHDYVRIRFESEHLIPREMDVHVSSCEYAYGGQLVNPLKKCPKCRVEWKKTLGAFVRVYFDCPKCGAKREDHVT